MPLKQPLLRISALLAAILTPITAAEAANYSAPTTSLPGYIQLNNVAIDGVGGSSSGGVLTALDNKPLYNGQVFQLTRLVTAEKGSADASYSEFEGRLLIPKMPQSALLLRTNANPLQFTVTSLSSSSGAVGAQGPIGPKGATGDQGPRGLTGAKGDQGPMGYQGEQGPIGLTGPKGDQGLAGLPGTNGRDGLTTSVNGVTQVNGAITLTKADIGLGNVDNTSDANKPISTAAQTALDLKANLASPTFTGIPAAPTAAAGTNTTQLATTAFVTQAVAGAAPLTHTIGETFGGGIVFYVTPNGMHGLVAATQDQSADSTWVDAPNVVSIPANYNAAGQNFTDWRLPTKNELNLLYGQRAVVGGFSTDFYWSATEYGVGGAWDQFFPDGNQYSDLKTFTFRVRAVRAF